MNSTFITSYERYNETNLDYAGARYLSTNHGRFTSVDPIGITLSRLIDPQQINRYIYTRNNPLKYVDPDGKDLKLKQGIKKADADRIIKRLVKLYRKEGGKDAIEKLAGSDFKFVVGTGKLKTDTNLFKGTVVDEYGRTERQTKVDFDPKAKTQDNSALVTPAKDITIGITFDFGSRDDAQRASENRQRSESPITEQDLVNHEIGHAQDMAENLVQAELKSTESSEKTANDFVKKVGNQKETGSDDDAEDRKAEDRIREILGVPKEEKKKKK